MSKLPNILLIVCDTLGAKHMSLYGYNRDTTPKLRQLVEREKFAVYTRCFAPAPWTVPSHASLFTGLYPSEHKIDGCNYYLNNNLFCLDEALVRLGYEVYFVSNNHFISRDLKYGRLATQFFEMWNFISSKDFYEMFKYVNSLRDLKGLLRLLKTSFPLKEKLLFIIELFYQALSTRISRLKKHISQYSFPHTIKSFNILSKLLTIDNNKNKFIFLNIIENHSKFNPPKKFRNVFIKDNNYYEQKFNTLSFGLDYYTKCHLRDKEIEYIKAQYDQEVLCIDSVLERFYLKNKTKLEDYIVIITSDHGESFLEDEKRYYIEHSFGVRNTNLHIPLLIKWPKDFNIHGEINHLVQLQDLYATIFDILDIPYPVPWSSKSLVCSDKRKMAISQLVDVNYKLLALKSRINDFNPWDIMQPVMSVITNDYWKVVRWLNDTIEIYNLNYDMYEDVNLLHDKSNREKITELIKLSELIAKHMGFNLGSDNDFI